MFRFSVFSILVAIPVGAASAHQDGGFHSHPHLLISNELLAGLLMIGALALFLAARKLAARRTMSELRTRTQRGRI